jgi:4-amino-4-deoxy-L-arabinose transferase-like glycosyltransferase
MMAKQALERMTRREAELRRANLNRMALGVGIVLGVLAVGIWGAVAFVVHIANKTPPVYQPNEHPVSPLRIALFVTGGLLAVTFLMAIFTRKESRSDVANQVMESGSRGGGCHDNPLLRLYLMIVMLGMIYGEFLIVDAIKATWVRTRLRTVDRQRAAMILGTVLSQVMDVETGTLRTIGESPMDLRQVLAYLIEYEWVDISADGNCLSLVSPARRALRH